MDKEKIIIVDGKTYQLVDERQDGTDEKSARARMIAGNQKAILHGTSTPTGDSGRGTMATPSLTVKEWREKAEMDAEFAKLPPATGATGPGARVDAAPRDFASYTRAEVLEFARKQVDPSERLDGMSDRDVMLAAIAKLSPERFDRGDFGADKSDAYLDGTLRAEIMTEAREAKHAAERADAERVYREDNAPPLPATQQRGMSSRDREARERMLAHNKTLTTRSDSADVKRPIIKTGAETYAQRLTREAAEHEAEVKERAARDQAMIADRLAAVEYARDSARTRQDEARRAKEAEELKKGRVR